MKVAGKTITLLGLLLILTAGCQTTAHDWEYKVVSMNSDVRNEGLQERINALAEEGWIVDQFADHHSYYRLIFRRAK